MYIHGLHRTFIGLSYLFRLEIDRFHMSTIFRVLSWLPFHELHINRLYDEFSENYRGFRKINDAMSPES